MMSFAISLLSLLLSRSAAAEQSPRRRARSVLSRAWRGPTARPRLEVLEDRTVLSTFLVTNTLDSGAGSLRQAILDANAAATGTAANPDRIQFNIPATDPHHFYYRNDGIAGHVSLANITVTTASDDSTINDIDPDWTHSWWSIQPAAGLPGITDTVVLDGYTQPGASPNTLALGDNAVLKVVLDGSSGGDIPGLGIGGSNCTVRGLVIDNCDPGISIYHLTSGPSGNVVQGNYIGLDASGSIALSGPQVASLGITVASSGGLIGGTTPAARNVIAGYLVNIELTVGTGVVVSYNNVVQGNYIGTNAAGTAVPAGIASYLPGDQVGVESVVQGNTIAGNLISGNPGIGINLVDTAAATIIQGNLIGTDCTGIKPVPNGAHGEPGLWTDAVNNLIGGTTPGAGNIIAFNGGAGVVAGGTGNSIEGNSIYGNGALGIDLNGDGVTLNTPGGPHAGSNHLQNFPVLTSASTSASGTTVSGTLNSVASTSFRIEFFSNTSPDPTGYGQGQTYLGFTNIATDASGNASFTASGLAALPAGQDYLAATATNLTTGDTSEFSQDLDLLLTNPTVTQSAGLTTVGFTLRNVPALSYTINWGDPMAPGTQTIPAGQSTVSHTYTTAGIYSVQATAQNQGAAPPATALVVISTQAADQVSASGGSAPGQITVTDSANHLSQTQSPTNLVVVSGSGGSDIYTVNFGSALTTPIYLFGGGTNSGDTLIANGDASSTNVINKTPGQITWGNPVTETVYRSGIPNTTINANGTSQNYVNDPGSNTVINGGPGTNTITITATTGNGVVINGGPHANNYIITMGNLLGPVTINSTAGTSTVTINGPPGSNVLTLSSTQLTGAGQTINFTLGSTVTSFTVSGGTGTNQLVVQGNPPAHLTAQNLAPTVGAITAPLAPTAINVAIAASAGFTNLDGNSQTAVWNWGDNTTSSGSVSQTGTSGTVTGSHSYTTDGVFTITLTVTDSKGGGATTSTFQYEVIYNPSAGFVTGGGWITSPAGAYAANPSLTGQANFGLNAKYHNGDTVPSGNTEFQFQPANLNFHATSYDWLVITTNQAQYQGSGTINGAGNYGFLVTALDGGGHGADLFRLKIWDKNNHNAVVYDTQPGAATTAAPTTPLGGGRIQVHTNAQLVAGGANPSGGNVAPLTLEELQPVVQEAIARWGAAGIDPGRLSALSQVTVGIAAFPGPWLGMAFPGAIWIDQTAAGYGWYLDPNSAGDSAFPATPGSPAYGKVDLLTVVEHELGHELGLEDTTGDGLMGVFLPTGVRRVPTLDLAPGDSAGQELVPPAVPQSLAPWPGSVGVAGPDAVAALWGAPPDRAWTAPAAVVGRLLGEAPPLASLVPVLPTVEKSSGVIAAAVPWGRREAASLWALDTVFASSQDSLVPAVG
jgi:hypothetical protein